MTWLWSCSLEPSQNNLLLHVAVLTSWSWGLASRKDPGSGLSFIEWPEFGFPFSPATHSVPWGSVSLTAPQFQMVLFIVDYVSLLGYHPVISCVTLFLRRHEQTFFHTPYQEPTTDQSTDTTRVELGEPMSFTVVTCRSRNDTQKKLRPQSPPQRGWQFVKARNMEHSAQPAVSSTGWRVSSGPGLTWSEPFPGSSAGLRIF